MPNVSTQILRYVILRHEGVAEPHFDWMIESVPGGALLTWRCPDWPIRRPMRLTRLGEHRRAYLEYEGPLTNNRGHVRRIAAGSCSMQWQSAAECIVAMTEQSLRIQQLDDPIWLATPIPQNKA